MTVRQRKRDDRKACKVIACAVMAPELDHLLATGEGAGAETEVLYLEQALHRRPDRLVATVQEAIDAAAQTAPQIALGYGLCAKGIRGGASATDLWIPRCHDCIALFLGSPERYLKMFRERPGTYYLTPGWLADHQDPLGLVEEHVPRFGRKTAQWVIEEELRNYTHIVLVDTGVSPIAPLRARAIENAAFFKKRYEEIPGSLDYFRELLRGPRVAGRFLQLGPAEVFAQEMLL